MFFSETVRIGVWKFYKIPKFRVSVSRAGHEYRTKVLDFSYWSPYDGGGGIAITGFSEAPSGAAAAGCAVTGVSFWYEL